MIVMNFEVRVEAMEKVEVAHWKVVKLLMVVMKEGESLVEVGRGQHRHPAPNPKTHRLSPP